MTNTERALTRREFMKRAGLMGSGILAMLVGCRPSEGTTGQQRTADTNPALDEPPAPTSTLSPSPTHQPAPSPTPEVTATPNIRLTEMAPLPPYEGEDGYVFEGAAEIDGYMVKHRVRFSKELSAKYRGIAPTDHYRDPDKALAMAITDGMLYGYIEDAREERRGLRREEFITQVMHGEDMRFWIIDSLGERRQVDFSQPVEIIEDIFDSQKVRGHTIINPQWIPERYQLDVRDDGGLTVTILFGQINLDENESGIVLPSLLSGAIGFGLSALGLSEEEQKRGKAEVPFSKRRESILLAKRLAGASGNETIFTVDLFQG